MVAKPRLLDFFAGAGLVTEAVKPHFGVVWANDICPEKASVYQLNHGDVHFHPG
jgi:DNA (cytosine-5)-methyltransferase 1